MNSIHSVPSSDPYAMTSATDAHAQGAYTDPAVHTAPPHPQDPPPKGQEATPDGGLAALMSMLHQPGATLSPTDLRRSSAEAAGEPGKAPAKARLLAADSGPSVKDGASGKTASSPHAQPQGGKVLPA
jgi:hypothetical protein